MTKVSGCPVAGLQSLSQQYLAEPGLAFETARRASPVFFEPSLGAWVVTRYEDVRWVLSDFATFSSRVLDTPMVRPAEFADRLPEDLRMETLLMEDPPDHTVIRKAMNKVFTRKRVATQDGVVREMADELIDGFVGHGRCDLMAAFADPLAWQLLVTLVGVADLERERLRAWSTALLTVVAHGREKGERERPDPDWALVADAWQYIGAILDDRRTNPRDDVQSAMLATTDDEGRPAFTDSEMVMMTFGIIFAGTGNTANLIANTVLMLSRHPQLAREVRDDPERIEGVIEEVLRRYPPALQLHRMSTREVEVGGTTIPAGSLVIASVPSACLDEAKFPEPARFDPDRENLYEHLGFGIGRHFCIGAPLARVVARAAVQTLYARIPTVRVPEQELRYERYPSLRNLLALDVEWDATAP